MEIILGETAGFCFGVANAVNKTIEELEKNKKKYCLGKLVHNEKVTNELVDKGLILINDIMEAPAFSDVIIRAHGVEPIVYEKAKEKNINIIDLTCPIILKIHDIVSEYAKQGYFVILTGNKNHPETVGSKGFAGENSVIVENENELEAIKDKIKKNDIKKILLVSQTTFSVEKFNNIEKELVNIDRNIEIEVRRTICNATATRQKETENISKKVDLMIIIGREKQF